MRRLLVIAGPLSGYSLALYGAVAQAWPCEVEILYEPLPATTDFAHEQVRFEGFQVTDWAHTRTAELAGRIQQSRPDAVIIHGTRARKAIVLATALLPAKTPFLYVCDSNIDALVSERGKLLHRLATYRALFARITVALSLGMSNELALRLLGATRIEPLPICAIDYPALEASRDAVPPPVLNGRRRIAIVSRMVKEKNLAAALRALGADAALRESVQLILVGDGPLRAELEQLALRLGLSCDFMGAVPRAQVGAIIGHADGLLLPSAVEPWGIVVCEALGLGIPVLATPQVGAAVSLAGHSRAVVLSASSDEADLVTALRDFCADCTELRIAARGAAPLVRQQYGLDAVTARLVGLLERLIV